MKTRRESRKLLGGICMVLGSLVFSLMVVLLVITQPAQAASSDYSITLKVSHSQTSTHADGQKHGHATRFKEIVETQTDGAVKVEIYPLSQLFSDKNSVLAVANGSIFGSILGTDVVSSYEKSLYLFQFPGLFMDADTLLRFMDSEKGGKEIERRLIGKGLFPGWWTVGPIYVFTSEKPITSLADSKGLKIRCNKSEVHNQTLKALGATAIHMSSGEMFTAAQTGMIDGAFTLEYSVTGRKLQEIFHYCLKDPMAFFNISCSIASMKILNEMPSQIRKIVQDAWVLTAKQHEQIDTEKWRSISRKQLVDSGMKFTSLDKESKATVVKSWLDATSTFGEKYGIEELSDEAVRIKKQ